MIDSLRANFNAATPIFVLIDPLLGEPLPDINAAQGARSDARSAGWHRAVYPVKLSPRTDLPEDLHPYLVELSGVDDPVLDLTLTLAQRESSAAAADGLDGDGSAAHRIGGWLQSSMHGDQLAAQLSSMFRLNTEARTDKTYLRLPDPRVLGLFRHVVGTARAAAQLGRIQVWAYLNARAQVEALRSTSETPAEVQLSRSEWALLAKGEAVQRALAQWRGEVGDTGLQVDDMYRRALAAADSAAAAAARWPHRFDAIEDEAKWAALSLVQSDYLQARAVTALLDVPATETEPAEKFRHLYAQLLAQAPITLDVQNQ
jgi:hypothetical protein